MRGAVLFWSLVACAMPRASSLEAGKDGKGDRRSESARLREAEARACDGLSETESSTSPLLLPGAVAAAAPLYPRTFTNYGLFPDRKLMGADVVLHATRGMTVEWLQRLVDCQIARDLAGDADKAAMRDCPLAVPGISASVRPVRAGFVVEISALAPGTGAAEEVWRRASKLATNR